MANEAINRRAALVEALGGVTERHRYIPSPIHPEDELQALSERLRGKANAEIAAMRTIYAAVSTWAGVEVKPGGSLPIVRDGQVIHWEDGSNFLGQVSSIAMASRLAPVSRLKAERVQLKNLLEDLQMARRRLEELDLEFSTTLDRTWKSTERGLGQPVDIVHALGINQALAISLHGAMRNIGVRLREIDEELAQQPSGRGRPKIRPAYEVARTFAQLYAQVTGKRPSCSVSDSMVSGEFAPALRDLFDALGWKSTDIRGPGNAAAEAVTDEYLRSCEPRKIVPFGGLLGLAR